MLQPVTTRVNGMLFLTGTSFFVPSLSIRMSARQLRDRRNTVYAEATRTGDPDLSARMVNAHVAAEAYVQQVCEYVLNERLAKYAPVAKAEEPVITLKVTKAPGKPRKAQQAKAVNSGPEYNDAPHCEPDGCCADVHTCEKAR